MMAGRWMVALVVLLVLASGLLPVLSSPVSAQNNEDELTFEEEVALVELELMEAFTAISLEWDNALDVLNLKIPQKPLLVLVYPGEEILVEGCGEASTSADGNPRYCVFDQQIPGLQVRSLDGAGDDIRDIQTNGVIVMPLEWLTRFKIGPGTEPDEEQFSLGVGFFLAHEFGHFVQVELSEQMRRPLPAGKQSELLSDCIAGDMFATAGQRVFRNPRNNPATLLKVFEDIGAAELDGTHGTPIERRDAFTFGYAYATIDASTTGIQGKVACISRYWPEMLGNAAI